MIWEIEMIELIKVLFEVILVYEMYKYKSTLIRV